MIQHSNQQLNSGINKNDAHFTLTGAVTTPLDLVRQLHFRPLIACALFAVGGAALGFQVMGFLDVNLETMPRWSLLMVWLFSLYAALWSNRFCFRALFPALAALFFASALLSAQRVVPPRNDISRWVNTHSSRMVVQEPLAVKLRGVVAARPQIGDFGIEFPLQVQEAQHVNKSEAQHRVLDPSLKKPQGRVWARFPLPKNDVSLPREGDKLEVQAQLFDLPRAGNYGERESRSRMIRNGCWSIARVRKNDEWRVIAPASATSLAARLESWRSTIVQRYETSFRAQGAPFPASNAQLLAALVWGEGGLREPLPRLTREQFRAAGMSHVLVASGTQIAIFCGILVALTRAVGLRRWSWLLVIAPLVLYAMLAGGASSIWRATVAGICVALALSWGRDIDGLSLWSLALMILFALDPMQLQDIGFQLTFAATWGLLALATPLGRVLERVWKRSTLRDLAALFLSAQIATTPILLYHFGRISLAAVGTNFFAVPVAGTLVTTGMLGLFLPLTQLNLWLVQSLDAVANLAARIPGAQTDLPPLRLGWTLFLYTMLLTALSTTSSTRLISAWWHKRVVARWRSVRPQSVLTTLILAACCIALWRVANLRDHRVRVTLLDVGQGESIVIRAPSGRTVLIDGGTSSDEGRGEVGRAVIVPYLKAMNVRHLDAMILTHADADHCSGLPFVTREVSIGMALDGAALHAQSSTREGEALPPEYEATVAAWRRAKVPVQAARSGQKLDLGDGVIITVLAPQNLPTELSENNAGAVVRLDYGQTSVLLTGDIEAEAEQQLVQSGMNLKCTILKVAHHGSKTSTTPQFLAVAQPAAALISAGRYNRYGHPARQTMNALARERIPTYRTDIDGAIEVACDGTSCDVKTFR